MRNDKSEKHLFENQCDLLKNDNPFSIHQELLYFYKIIFNHERFKDSPHFFI